ncbi:hypothetical protein MNBD_NITROSPINAE04-2274 [hydrothermal vent metagenome]|uniref:histidine kinase n=1 Tax=hydrothermal vent metagenome TaxID=652676 RepID=A0A3B1CFK9_9ZZZZ
MTQVGNKEIEEETITERHNRILSSITHDLKSPINAIISCASLLNEKSREDFSDPMSGEFLKMILKAGHEAHSLVQGILTMAKMEAGKDKIEPELVFDIKGELSETINTFRYEAEARNIKIIIEVENPLPVVRWDMKRLRLHALNNLISNALKFSPSGGTILVSAETDGNMVVLKVEDDGIGVPPEERERIFKRFEQVGLTSTRVFKGAGLGLHNARMIVERHGGDIYALDATKGKGAAFVMLLPFTAEEPMR